MTSRNRSFRPQRLTCYDPVPKPMGKGRRGARQPFGWGRRATHSEDRSKRHDPTWHGCSRLTEICGLQTSRASCLSEGLRMQRDTSTAFGRLDYLNECHARWFEIFQRSFRDWRRGFPPRLTALGRRLRRAKARRIAATSPRCPRLLKRSQAVTVRLASE